MATKPKKARERRMSVGRSHALERKHIDELETILLRILRGLKKVMSTQTEAAAELAEVKSNLGDLKSQLEKATQEITTKIDALTNASNNATNTDPALQTAIDDVRSIGESLKPVVQALDNIGDPNA